MNQSNPNYSHMNILWLVALAIIAFAVSFNVQATELNIAQEPLFLSKQLAPNVVLTLDDSGSMAYAYVPDSASSFANSQGFCLTWDVKTDHHGNKSKDCSDYSDDANPRFASNAGNPLYYNPNVTYTPPVDADGNPLSTSFTSAWRDGFDHSEGSIDLSTDYKVTTNYIPWAGSHLYLDTIGDSQPAYYFVYDSSRFQCSDKLSDSDCYEKVVVSDTSGPDGKNGLQNFANWFSFYRTRNLTTISAASLAMQNFGSDVRIAWQSLNSCNSLTSWQDHSAGDDYDCKGWAGDNDSDGDGDGDGYDNGIAKFKNVTYNTGDGDADNDITIDHRTDFYHWLFHLPASGSTPLREALVRAGDMYDNPTANKDSPYAENPQISDGTEFACRQNYAIIMTDGLWNEGVVDNYTSPPLDSSSLTLPVNTSYSAATYSAMSPYEGGSTPDSDGRWYHTDNSPSLANIAFHYWATDLNTSLDQSSLLAYTPVKDDVTYTAGGKTQTLTPYWNPKNDPATWQHMVTFTVGLGLNAFLNSDTPPNYEGSTYTGDYAGLVTGAVPWPKVGNNSSNNVSDLWHAAIVSRGQFFGADTPKDLSKAFNTIIKRIVGRTSSASAIAANSTSLSTHTKLFQGLFNSGDWSGELIARYIETDGDIGKVAWQASTGIPAYGDRKIFTIDPTTGDGIEFQWSDLTAAQKTDLESGLPASLTTAEKETAGQNRLSYLRGNQSLGSKYRTRSTILGDIIHSNPFYAGAQRYNDAVLSAAEGGSAYPTYVVTKRSRTPVVYVGANDGMLHAFNADDGTELFAYVPDALFPKLSKLTNPNYVKHHQYYVDGSPQAIDAYVDLTGGGTKTWQTILVGSTGSGAKDIFALNVSNPNSFGASDVLWEFSGQDDNDLGYVLGTPSIALLHNGDWAAIFGNGYNSTNQHAVLFIVNLTTGDLIKKIDTGVGSTSDPNGLSTPIVVDTDGDGVADYVYAGDLYGNLWKFNLTSNSKGNWEIAYGSPTSPKPMFTASYSTEDAGGATVTQRQPITEKPTAGRTKTGKIMVFFGTGTYFKVGDNVVGANPPTQTLYGIQDPGVVSGGTEAPVQDSDLLQQKVLTATTVNGTEVQVSTGNTISTEKGWYLNLPESGGRMVTSPVFESGRILFSTTVPTTIACSGGGSSWLWDLQAASGSRLKMSPFDLSGPDGVTDTQFDDYDFVTVTVTIDGETQSIKVPVSAKHSKNGINSRPIIIHAGRVEYIYTGGTKGVNNDTGGGDNGGGDNGDDDDGSNGTAEKTTASNPNPGGRTAWRQMN